MAPTALSSHPKAASDTASRTIRSPRYGSAPGRRLPASIAATLLHQGQQGSGPGLWPSSGWRCGRAGRGGACLRLRHSVRLARRRGAQPGPGLSAGGSHGQGPVCAGRPRHWPASTTGWRRHASSRRSTISPRPARWSGSLPPLAEHRWPVCYAGRFRSSGARCAVRTRAVASGPGHRERRLRWPRVAVRVHQCVRAYIFNTCLSPAARTGRSGGGGPGGPHSSRPARYPRHTPRPAHRA